MGEIEVAIEHLEPRLSKWILLEYKHVSKMVGKERLHFTNIIQRKDIELLSKYGIVHKESIVKLIHKSKWDNVLILDPRSNKLLEPQDFTGRRNLVVIGGIMGDHPPRGRTYQLLTSRILRENPRNVKVVSLGKHQFSIDGTAYMVLQVFKGRRITEIPIVKGVSIKLKAYVRDAELEIYLPFAYPLINGKPLLTPGLVDYLRHGILSEEVEIIEKFLRTRVLT